MKKFLRSGWAVGGIAVSALALNIFSGLPLADATHEPANKTSAAGSSTEFIPGTETTPTVILSEFVKTSKPTDLILGVTLECSITTEVTTVGSDDQTAFGQIRVWVEIDGVPVKVAQDDPDNGRVVFCNRTYQRTTTLFDDEDATIKTFMQTRSANGFNWMALDVGSAVHKIEVKAALTLSATTDKTKAAAVIGNRTLIVEPTKAANDEAVTEIA